MAATGALFCTSSRGLSFSSPTIESPTVASLNKNACSQERFGLPLGYRTVLSVQNRQGLLSSSPTIQSSRAPPNVNASSRTRFSLWSDCGCERTLLLVKNYDARKKSGAGRANDLRTLVPRAAVKDEQPQLSSSIRLSTLKEFLEDVKAVGRVRLIVNTGVAVLESVTSLEKVFYHATSRGEYANVMSRDDNVDFHLLVEKVALARLVKGMSMKGDIPTYMVRFVDVNDSAAVSVLVMWKPGTDGEYDPGQVKAFEALVAKYGEEVKFSTS